MSTRQLCQTTRQLLKIIDTRINNTLNEVLHQPELQSLEGSWRGLWSLCQEVASITEAPHLIRIELLALSWQALNADLAETDKGCLFDKIYTERLEQAGGEPINLLLADYMPPTSSLADCQAILTQWQRVLPLAARCYTVWLQPAFTDLWVESTLNIKQSQASVINAKLLAAWQNLRCAPESRFLGLLWPPILQRELYSYCKIRCTLFQETGLHSSDYVWGTGLYQLAILIAQCFAETGWFLLFDLTTELNRCLPALPQISWGYDQHHHLHKYPLATALTDEQEHWLAEQGIIALGYHPDNGKASIFHPVVVHQVSTTKTSRLTINDHSLTSCFLHESLCLARIAHFCKMLLRHQIGSLIIRQECQNRLTRWLQRYTANRDDLTPEMQAKYPLKAAEVTVTESRSGHYNCVIRLQMHTAVQWLNITLDLKPQ